MTLCGIDKRWIALSSFPAIIDCNDCTSILNNNELIIATLYNDCGGGKGMNGIHKYNIHKNEWIQVMRYPTTINGDMQIETMAIGQGTKKNKIYLGDYQNNKLWMFDYETRNLSALKSKYNVFEDSSMINVNGIFHNIGGNKGMNPRHVTWNSHNDKTIVIHDFKEEDGFQQLQHPSTVYVPSKQMILLIGGRNDTGEYNNRAFVGIWKFCLITKKWKKLTDLQFNYYNVCCCLTSDQQYVIIGGGHRKGEYMNKLYVLDIRKDNEFKLVECDIKLPMDNVKCRIVRSGGGMKDEILVVGWIKKQFKKRGFKNLSLPPLYIMQLIALWYNNEEMIHWFTDNPEVKENNHYCIKLKHILCCIQK